MTRATALGLVLASLVVGGCEATPGTPIPPDADDGSIWTDDAAGYDGPMPDAAPRDTAPPDLGIYDAPVVEAGNCLIYPPDGAPIEIECDPGTTCDVSGVEPFCANGEEAGVTCGSIGCVGAGGCADGGRCVGFYD
jgi:hypothetical protein